MKLVYGRDEGLRVERMRGVARTGLACSLVTFFVSVVLLGARIGDPVFAEGAASFSSLAIALSGFAYIALGLSAARQGERDTQLRSNGGLIRARRPLT